jgi:hypothetical protein
MFPETQVVRRKRYGIFRPVISVCTYIGSIRFIAGINSSNSLISLADCRYSVVLCLKEIDLIVLIVKVYLKNKDSLIGICDSTHLLFCTVKSDTILDFCFSEEISCKKGTETWKAVLERLHVGGQGYETAAVLTMTEAEASAAYKYLKQHRKDVYYIDRDSSVFRKGVTVTTYYMAKGLEFDQVFMVDDKVDHPFYTQYQYISATRALHELYKLGT